MYTIFVCAWTTYLHGPDRTGKGCISVPCYKLSEGYMGLEFDRQLLCTHINRAGLNFNETFCFFDMVYVVISDQQLTQRSYRLPISRLYSRLLEIVFFMFVCNNGVVLKRDGSRYCTVTMRQLHIWHE